jgi:hypothetical protein
MSYITGAHVFKVGFNNAYGHHENTTYTDPARPYSYSFANGVPTQITMRIRPRTIESNVDRDLGVFVQDRWTTGRLTLSGGLRYDSFASSFPQQSVGPTFFAPGLNVTFPDQDALSWHDITPKLGATYDIFGTGRTALKVTLNKYLEGLGTTGGFAAADNVSDAPNPINRLNTQDTRTWNDVNRNFVPDCNLLDFAGNGECGPLANAATFGTVTPGTTYDPDLMQGWGKRVFNWEFTTSIQHEILPRLGIDVQYARRWYGNLRVADDRSVGPADYERFTFAVPADPRLPDGGGYTLTGFDLRAGAPAQSLFVTLADNFGGMSEHFDGVNVTVNARMQNGVVVQGGMGTGRQVTNDCGVVEQMPELLHTFLGTPSRVFVFSARPLERCEQNNGWRTQLQGLASYVIPKIDVQVSGTFQNLPGAQLAANASIQSSTTSLGRRFGSDLPAPGPAFGRFFNIVEAGEVFVERLNQIDVRVGKIFRMAGTRTSVNFDFYNVLNSNAVISENATFGPGWRTPQSILLPRLFKLNAQFDW